MQHAKGQGKGKATQTGPEEIIIERWERVTSTFYLLGITPFVCNRQSEKAKRDLLFPKGPKTRAEKQGSMKHNPLQEYRDSPYRTYDPKAPTAILMLGGAFKSAVCDSAVDTPGLQAAQMRRLISVPDYYVSIYGVPELWMTGVIQAGISRTPDIRTRAIIPNWAAIVRFTFSDPLVNQKQLTTLVYNGGLTRGVGDGRVEKGALDFGQFEPVQADDKRFRKILETGGYAAQAQALEAPEFYDEETASLYTWFQEEVVRRGKDKKPGKDAEE